MKMKILPREVFIFSSSPCLPPAVSYRPNIKAIVLCDTFDMNMFDVVAWYGLGFRSSELNWMWGFKFKLNSASNSIGF